jgi:hypothetical protein
MCISSTRPACRYSYGCHAAAEPDVLPAGRLARALWTSRVGHEKVVMRVPCYVKEDVLFLKELIDAGKYQPVIGRRYPLEQFLEATTYVETHQKTGNVVVVVNGRGAAQSGQAIPEAMTPQHTGGRGLQRDVIAFNSKLLPAASLSPVMGCLS